MAEQTPWWVSAKASSLERKAAAAKTTALAQPGDSFLIVTEGTVTEPVYFNLLRESLQLSTVTVKVIPGRHSDPRHVIQSAADEVKELAKRVSKKRLAVTELERFDHVWSVIDTDVAVREGFWNDVVQKARDLKINLAHSTPCFEYWLLLHLGMSTRSDLVNGDAAKAALKQELGTDYSTNRSITESVFERLIPLWPTAAIHAQKVRQLHTDAKTPPPANPSTDVDLLACSLNDSAAPHLRVALG